MFSFITSIGSIGRGTSGLTLSSPVGSTLVLSAGFISVVVDSVDIFVVGRKSPLGLSMTEIVVFSALIVVVCITETGSVVNVGCGSLPFCELSGWLPAFKLWNVVGSTEI